MKLVLVLDNIRSCYNVGAILRTAEGFGVNKVILSGYTPRIHDKSLLPHLRDKLDREIHKTALGAEDLLTIASSDNIKADLVKYKKTGWQVIGLEDNITTDNLLKLGTAGIGKKLSDKIVLILGEEVKGIDRSLYDTVDLFLEIPMKGKKESFNVSVAAGIAMYAIMES